MSSPSSSTASSTPSTPRSHTASATHSSTRQTSGNVNEASNQTSPHSNIVSDPTEPSERWTGELSKVMNRRAIPATRWSVHKARVEGYLPEILRYYEGRRTGVLQERPFEEWGERLSKKKERQLYLMEHLKTQRTFRTVDYRRGFTGRGCK